MYNRKPAMAAGQLSHFTYDCSKASVTGEKTFEVQLPASQWSTLKSLEQRVWGRMGWNTGLGFVVGRKVGF